MKRLAHPLIRALSEPAEDIAATLRTSDELQPQTNIRRASKVAVMLIALRRQREMIFGTKYFADPVWDMLLDLYVASSAAQPVAVSSLCVAAAVPTTTALRWIDAMEQDGLCRRTPDPNDKRRSYVELTRDATDAMTNLLSGWSEQR